jgi:hypothetical protein
MSTAKIRTSTILDEIYGDLVGWIEVRALPSKARIFCRPNWYSPLQTFVANHKHENVYVGAALRRTTDNGTSMNCAVVPAVWADLDRIAGSGGPCLPGRCPQPGLTSPRGGLHCWWL